MAESGDAFHDLVTHAQEARVVVIGGGIAGLVAALECAKVGMRVTVLEESAHLGGTIAAVEVDGLHLDIGATSWQARSPEMNALVTELGLDARVVSPARDDTWIAGLAKGAAAPMPRETVLGIPANTWDESVRRVIGWSGTWRAYLDRLRPPLTIGVSRNLGGLTRSRMGDRVHDLLVAPLSIGRYGISPDDVDVDVAAPGLNTALTRTGSLSGAVADLRVDASDGPTFSSLDGGMTQLVDALAVRLIALGAEVRVGTRVLSLVSDAAAGAAGGWRVDYESSDAEGVEEPTAREAEADGKPGERVGTPASIVIIATPEAQARGLLESALGRKLDTAIQPRLEREIVTLVVDAPALDAPPRGVTVYPVPGSPSEHGERGERGERGASGASGVVHQTARWEWLARAAGDGRHVLSVAFDRREADGLTAPEQSDSSERARNAASALLGVPIPASAVRGAHSARHALAWPASARGHAERTEAVRSALADRRGLVAVGAWLSGSGLAAVVADAVREADRSRAAALWAGTDDD